MTDIRPGDQVYLIARRPTAPTIAYKQPKVTVVSLSPGQAVVELADTGVRIEVHPDNLATRPPTPPKPKPRPAIDPKHGEEVTLW